MQIAQQKKAPLEHGQRLSRSLLWRWQRRFFERHGMEAWSQGLVPHQITSNPFIADAYARVVLGFLRDCREGLAGVPLDRDRPVYLVELGSGCGRFAYLFLKKLLSLRRGSPLEDVPIRYVMTDFTQRNLDAWREHAWLRPWFETGVLDLARFDVEGDREMTLQVSGERLAPGTGTNPWAVFANYLFDSIPQDAFRVEGGQLFEMLVTTRSRDGKEDPADPAFSAGVEISCENRPVEGAYYGDPLWNQFLESYRQRLPAASFLFPTAALEGLRTLSELAGGRMLLLSADRGYHQDEALLLGQGEPRPIFHGSFSFMVDYHILGEHCRLQGGEALHPAHHHQYLNVSALLYGAPSGSLRETRQAYAEAIEKFGPDDLFTLQGALDQAREGFNLQQTLAYLRLTGWDPKRFRDCLPTIKREAEGASPPQRVELHDAIQRVWDAYLPIGEEDDLAFHLGTLLIELELYAEALPFLQTSVALYGVEPGTAYNLALCHHSLRQAGSALEWLDRALELDPSFDAARSLRLQIEAP